MAQLDGNGYDPVKAHQYYERTKQLKGKKKGSSKPSSTPSSSSGSSSSGARGAVGVAKPQPRLSPKTAAAKAKVARLKGKIATLQGALSEAQAALSAKRQTATKEAKKNSDGKTTAKERQAAKEYRDKHQGEIAAKRKKEKSSGSAPKSVSDMGVEELQARITKIRSALADAKKQLSNASQQLGQLAHSDLTSNPMFNEQFAQFHSAEGIPSK